MRSRRSLLRNNPLLQRVRRHASMATLYRATDVDEEEPGWRPAAGVAGDQAGKPAVMASLITWETGAADGLPEEIGPAVEARSKRHAPVPPPAVEWRPGQPGPVAATSPAAQRQPDELRPAAVSPGFEGKPDQPGPAATTPPAAQRQTSQSGPSAAGPAAPQETPPARPADPTKPDKPSQASDFNWISEGEWARLKRFMQGHQEKLAREQTTGSGQAQLKPEEQAQQEAERRAKTEIESRQELARTGRLPRAKVEYLTGESRTGEMGPAATPASSGETTQRMPVEPLAGDQVSPPIGPGEQTLPASETRALETTKPVAETPSQTPVSAAEPGRRAESSETASEQHPVEERPPALIEPEEASPEVVDTPPIIPGSETMRQARAEEPSGATDIPAEVEVAKPAESSLVRRQAEGAPDIKPKAASEPKTKRTEAEKPAGLGRRLFDAARSLFRDETETSGEGQPSEPAPAAAGETTSPVVQEPAAIASPPIQATRQAEEAPAAGAPAQLLKADLLPEEPAAGETSLVAAEPEATDAGPGAGASLPAGEEVSRRKMASPADTTPGQPPAEAAAADRLLPEAEGRKTASFGDKLDINHSITPEFSSTPGAGSGPDLDETQMFARDFDRQADEGTGPIPAGDELDEGMLSPATGEEVTQIQRLPLDKVWPVEKIAPPPPASGPPLARRAESLQPGPAVQRKPAGSDELADGIHTALKDVIPGQPTDSAIELVTPRRPRPAAQTSPEVRRKPLETRPTETKMKPLAEVSDHPATKTEPWLVETEIGRLPSDLWELLGEKPPLPAPKAGQPDVQRAATPATSPPKEAGESSSTIQELLFPAVQRAEEVSRASVPISQLHAPVPSEEDRSSGQQAPEVDVEQLARQVYPDIKRRLSLEWERRRGRF